MRCYGYDGIGIKLVKGLQPTTEQERQAVHTVAAAKGVLAEVDVLRRKIANRSLNPQDRFEAQRGFEDAIDRLSNLMALAIYQLTSDIGEDFRGHLRASLDALRGQLLDMGANLMLDKLKKVRTKAEGVLAGSSYPLGLAAKLEAAYGTIRAGLEVLGALDRMSEAERQSIDETHDMISRLASIEEKIGAMSELSPPAPPAG